MRAQEFTEPGAAGIVLYAEDTGRWGLQQRSDSVNDPGLWAAWGGGKEPGESLEQCARRELAEEGGYTGPIKLHHLADNPKYTTFIGVVPHEFEPRANDEWKDYCWVEGGDWPSPMHPGVASALKNIPVNESVPQPGASSGAPTQFAPGTQIQNRQMTAAQIIKSIPGVPYYNNVVDDWDAKDYSWGVTKKVIEYAEYLKQHPESLAKLPPIQVVNGEFKDGAHRVSAIWLLQQRMDPQNPLWKNAKLNVQFAQQNIDENFANGKVKGMQKADQDHLIRQIQTARKLGDSQFDEALVHRGLITKQDPNDIWHVRDDATRKLRHHKGAVILAQAQPKIYSAGQAMKSYQLEPRYDGKMIRSLPSFHYAYIQGKMLPKLPSDIDQGRQLWFQSGKGFVYADTKQPFQGADYVYFGPDKKVIAYNSAKPVAISGPEVSVKPAEEVAENFADGKVKGKSRPGRVKRAGASCDGSVTDLRQRAKNASGEKARMYHWCANMKSGKKK